MSKIVQAVNAMIANSKLITTVVRRGDDLFFLYKDKYKWSIAKRGEEYLLWFYPGKETLEQIASHEGADWDKVDMVTYRDSEIGTHEAKASFSELYQLLGEKVYGVNDVLDDIISDESPF